MRAMLMAVVLGAALAACGQPATKASSGAPPQPAAKRERAEPVDPSTLEIEIGRWGAMLDQTFGHTATVPGNPPADRDVMARRVMAAVLRGEVHDLNKQRAVMCAEGRLTAMTCVAPFAPAWLAEAADVAPSFEELADRSDAVGEQVSPLWNAACEQVEKAVGPESIEKDGPVCPME